MSTTIKQLFRIPISGSQEFAQLKARHPVGELVPATLAQVYTLLDDLQRHLPETIAEVRETLRDHLARHPQWGNDQNETGGRTLITRTSSQVGYLIPPAHTIGIDIAFGTGGWILTQIELRKERIEALRRHGRLVAYSSTGILRSESYGPIRRK